MDDLYVDEPEVIKTDQIAEIPIIQILFNIQHFGTIVGEAFQSCPEIGGCPSSA